MKNLAELQALRDELKDKFGMRHDAPDNIQIIVSMGDCGFESGGRPVLSAIAEEVGKHNLQNVTVAQMDCPGDCANEPFVEVIVPGKDKVVYANINPEKAIKIVNEHVINNKIVTEYIKK